MNLTTMSFLIGLAGRVFAAVARRTTHPHLQTKLMAAGSTERTQDMPSHIDLKALEGLLLGLFSQFEFERFFTRHYAPLRNLINFRQAPAEVIFEAIGVWKRHRCIDDELLQHILEIRPFAADEIRQVFGWGFRERQ